MLTAVCASSTIIVGSASLSRVGRMGPVRIAVRVVLAALPCGLGARMGANRRLQAGIADHCRR